MVEFTGKASDFLKIGVATAARGDLPTVRKILRAKPNWLLHRGSHGRTMLWEACHRGKLEMVKYLVGRGADIDACGSYYTPYFVEISCYCIARHKKRNEIARFLKDQGAKIDIFTAAFLGDLEMVKQFFRSDRRVVHRTQPQHEMAAKNEEGLEFVLDENEWATPLCYALRGADPSTVRFLIEKGARINGIEGCLFIAADDNPEMVRILLENGADPERAPRVSPGDELYDIVSKYGVPQVSKATLNVELVYLCRGDRGGNPVEVKKLLDNGADVNAQDHKGKTALHRAAKAGFLETMDVLLDAGAKIDVPDHNGETALFDAIRSTIRDVNKQKKSIRWLLNSGASKRHKNRRDQDPLSVARSTKRKSELTPLLSLARMKK